MWCAMVAGLHMSSITFEVPSYAKLGYWEVLDFFRLLATLHIPEDLSISGHFKIKDNPLSIAGA